MSYKKKFLNKSGVSSPISGANSNSGAWNGMNDSSAGGFNNTDLAIRIICQDFPKYIRDTLTELSDTINMK